MEEPGEFGLLLPVLDFGEVRLSFGQQRQVRLEGVIVREQGRGRGASTGDYLQSTLSEFVGQREVLAYGVGEPRTEYEDAVVGGEAFVHHGDRR